MKILKIITGIVFLLLLLQGYTYLNLMVSDKYETDKTIIKFSDLSKEEKQKAFLKMEKRAKEIEKQKMSTIIMATILFIIFIVNCIFLLKKPYIRGRNDVQ